MAGFVVEQGALVVHDRVLVGMIGVAVAELVRRQEALGQDVPESWRALATDAVAGFRRPEVRPLVQPVDAFGSGHVEWITTADAATHLGATGSFVARLVRLGRLDGVKADGAWRISLQSVEQYAATRRRRSTAA